jgi:hypothetical protein
MKKLHLRHFACLLMLLFTAHWSWGQGTTTSSMSGIITDQKGEGLPGATVIAIHTPTNTQYVGPTNSQGRFNLQNMRVGGPYTVRVSFVGFQEVSRNNIQLTIGQDYRLDIKMLEATTELGAVTITAVDPRSTLNAERSGPVNNISTEQLQQLPTITRSLNDFLRTTPQSSPTSQGAIGGGNYRQNNITIDGSDFNNNFGIGGNLPANGYPVSLDAIEALTVSLSPFDVRQSGFVGSAVNAVTRSGSNQVTGSVYGFYRNQNYIGRKVGSNELPPLNNTSVKQYGFRLGGPIVKDKLFFFVNAERNTEDVLGQQNIASTGGAAGATIGTSYGSAGNIARPSADYLNGVSNYLQSTYGYAAGPYQGYNFQNERTQVLGRLDWNINSKNHLSVRYNQVTSKTPSFVSTSRSPLGNFPNSRTSLFALPFANANYATNYNFYSGAIELNSTIGTRFFNTLRGTYTHQNEPRSSNSSPFPFVDILDGSAERNVPTATNPNGTNGFGTTYSNPLTSFGYEPFSLGNLRDVETYSAVDFISATFGKHTTTFGGQFDLQSTKNGFQRFASSYYAYNSWNDFISGANPVDFAITYSLLPNFEQAYPRFKTAQYSLYAQDEFNINDNFRLTYGLRAELNNYLNVREVQTHPLIAQRTFVDNQTIDTGVLPKNRVLLSPRIGFNWDVKGDRTLQLRGGSGIFTGKVPTVWIVAQSGDAGLIQVTQTYTTTGSTTIRNANGTTTTVPGVNPANVYGSLPGFANGVLPFSADPNAHRPATPPPAGTVVPSTISATNPNFRNPQTWKSSLALDAKLPGGIVGTIEGLYNRDLIVAYGQNYNLNNPTTLTTNGNDKRDIYPADAAQKFVNPVYNGSFIQSGNARASSLNAIVLSNGYKGYNWSVTGQLRKQFRNGMEAMVAYTRSDARVMFDGTGDQLLNTWSGNYVVGNANHPQLSYANYVVPDRVVASLNYRKEYLKHLGTQISLFYSGSIQGRYSYIYGSDFNGDGQANDLMYIPKSGSEINFADITTGTGANQRVLFTAQQQKDAFFAYIAQDSYLSKHQGEYAQRNGATLPWRNQIDVRFAQDIFVAGATRNTLQFTVDIFNFGNLINRNWGIYQTNPILSGGGATLVSPTAVANNNGAPTFRMNTFGGALVSNSLINTVSTASTYYMQIGLRYSFN